VSVVWPPWLESPGRVLGRPSLRRIAGRPEGSETGHTSSGVSLCVRAYRTGRETWTRTLPRFGQSLWVPAISLLNTLARLASCAYGRSRFGAHEEIVLQAVARGHTLVCEKPLAPLPRVRGTLRQWTRSAPQLPRASGGSWRPNAHDLRDVATQDLRKAVSCGRGTDRRQAVALADRWVR